MSKSQIGPGNHEKAWNDPPQLAFGASNTSQSSSNRLRMMKKRIPVPMNSTSCSSETSPQQKLLASNPPPIGIPPSDKSLKLNETEIPAKEDSFLDSSQVLQEIEDSLKEICNNLVDDVLENSSKEDILKRINIFKELWIQDKLPLEVKKQMNILSAALKEQNYDLAWSLHQSLMVDYTTNCSSWMLGIKTLINGARKSKTPGKVEDRPIISDKEASETNSLPLLIASPNEKLINDL